MFASLISALNDVVMCVKKGGVGSSGLGRRAMTPYSLLVLLFFGVPLLVGCPLKQAFDVFE
jgi:hypothetical protein